MVWCCYGISRKYQPIGMLPLYFLYYLRLGSVIDGVKGRAV